MESGLEHGLSDRQRQDRGDQLQHVRASYRQPCGDDRQEDAGAGQVGSDHAALRVPSVGPAADPEHGEEDDESLQSGQVTCPGPDDLDGDPAERDGVKLIAKRGERHAAPEQGDWSTSQGLEDAHVNGLVANDSQ